MEKIPDEACPLMCEECPLLPPGVRARLTNAETVTRPELDQFRFAQEAPELAKHWTGRIRITATAISSTRPRVEVGDNASMLIRDPGPGAAGIADLVRKCRGRRWLISFRWLAFKRVCGCLGPQFRNDV